MKQYLNLLQDVLDNGEHRPDRTGTGTISVFDRHMSFDLEDGFPAVTTKKLAFKTMVGELLWFINGETTISELKARTFGDPNADKWTIWTDNQADYYKRLDDCGLKYPDFDADCGNIYGKLWHHDNQFWSVVERIITNPSDRRLIVNAWIPEIVNDNLELALPPCHYGFQFYVRGLDKDPRGTHLDLKFNMRSNDIFLGAPFNIASYATLLHIVAKITGLKAGRVSCSLGDVHIYSNHIEQVKEQLSREPKALPKLVTPFDDFAYREVLETDPYDVMLSAIDRVDHCKDMLRSMTANDFELSGYDPHPAIKAPLAV